MILVLSVILIVFSGVTIAYVNYALKSDMDQRLESEGGEIILSIDYRNGKFKIVNDFEWKEPHHISDYNPVYIIVIDTAKIVHLKSKNYMEQISPVRFLNFDDGTVMKKTIVLQDIKIRFITQPIYIDRSHKGWIITGTTYKQLETFESVLISIYSIIFPLALIFAFLGSFYVAKKSLQPIQDISETIRNINYQTLEKSLPQLNSKDEVAHLSATINELLDRLRISFRTIRQFTANASHELKLPMTIIKAELEQVQDAITKKTDIPNLERTFFEFKRLSKLVDDLSILAKVDSKQIVLHKKLVWIHDLIYKEIERFRAITKTKNISLKTNELPSISIMADEYWFELMISNLLDNAIKFSPENSVIEMGLNETEPDKIILFIQDQGPGINEMDLKNITKRFFRSEASGEIAGSGLGLSIVKWVVESLGGTIEFQNCDPTGLRVTIILTTG